MSVSIIDKGMTLAQADNCLYESGCCICGAGLFEVHDITIADGTGIAEGGITPSM